MVRNDDDQSFLTFAQILHPEMAPSGVSRRHPDESPWATVYYEAVSGPVDYENMPVAMDVVAVDDDVEAANPQQPQEMRSGERPGTHPLHSNTTSAPLPKPQPWQHSNLIDLLLGFALAITAFICTLKIELTAILIYTLAAGFHYASEEIFTTTPALLPRSICMTLCSILMIVDPILLTVSVLVSELVGFVALLVCSIVGGPRSGQSWHQFIRKTCHLSRWGFRRCHKGWKPHRIFPISMEDERFQLGTTLRANSMNDEEDEMGFECASPSFSRQTYRDTVDDSCGLGSPECHTATTAADDSTVSEITFTEHGTVSTANDIEVPAIAIAPENVSVVEADEPFLKNLQEVTMT